MVRAATMMLSVLIVACSGDGTADAPGRDTQLRFDVPEGESVNHFLRDNGIAGHLNLRYEPSPRLVFAFPAGNSGAIAFFDSKPAGGAWGRVTALDAVTHVTEDGRRLYGLQADIVIDAARLRLTRADVGSVRFLRGAVDYSRLPARPAPRQMIDGERVRFFRERPDGQSAYLLQFETIRGSLRVADDVEWLADGSDRIVVRVLAASGDRLLAPLPAGRLLADRSDIGQPLAKMLAYLTYEQKMLAGSWRCLTYFGRDTLLTLRMMMPVLAADAVEAGLASVLERVGPGGDVAHEEDIGELAVYRNLAARGEATAQPVYDYDMIDDNLLLAPVFAHYVATFGVSRAAEFLSQSTAAGIEYRTVLAHNLDLVARQATTFAAEPIAANLLAIRADLPDGNWRDSEEGLAGGRFPYDVNAVLMPAALNAARAILADGLLAESDAELPNAEVLANMLAVWRREAPPLFRVAIAAGEAAEQVAGYTDMHGLPPVAKPAKDVEFDALALAADLEPIPVMHSDVGFDLLFLRPSEQRLEEIVSTVHRQFPVGLATPVGVVAANPAFAPPSIQAQVTRNHYHGTVVWSWQQAMLLAGLDAQLARDDLSEEVIRQLSEARNVMWARIDDARDIVSSELWTFAIDDGRYRITPFGQQAGHRTESNAVQLWSTVFLALQSRPATNR